MSRVFISQNSGAGVYVFSDDHCPPHVRARHRGEGWIARVSFSYLSNRLHLLSVAPLRNSPLHRTMNRLLGDIGAELPACRRSWWAIRQTTCLANQWVAASTAGVAELSAKAAANARRIAEAIYDPEQERLQVTFLDGTTLDMSV